MKEIKNLIFDLGGVIINLDNRLTEKAFVELGVRQFSEYFGHGFAAAFFKEYEVGKLTNEEFIRELKKMTGLNLSDDILIKAWNALLLDFPPERIELLKRLKSRFRLFLFSNTNALHLEKLNQIYTETFGEEKLDTLFEKAYYSHLMGLRKPDLESFHHIVSENNLVPGQTLFIDDAHVNVEGARAAGLKGYYLEPGKTILDIDWD